MLSMRKAPQSRGAYSMKYITGFIILLTLSCSNKQVDDSQRECAYPILLDIYGVYHTFNAAPDTITITISENAFAKIILFNCQGKLDLEGYTRDSILSVKGSYIEAIDTSHAVTIVEDLATGKTYKETSVGYKPLKDGLWQYFDSTGKLTGEELYEKGFLKR